MGYLIWFDPENHPAAAREFVLFFRNQELTLQEGPPGLLLEAIQGCEWCRLGDECRGCPLEEWESGEPPWTPVTRSQKVAVLSAAGKIRDRKQRFTTRKWIHGAPPDWFFYEEFLAWPEGGNPQYLLPVWQANVFLFTGRPGDSPPSLWPGDPRLLELVQHPSWRELLELSPAERYKRLWHLLEQECWEAENIPVIPVELWPVVEEAYSVYHPFPDPWLTAHGYSGPKPAFCFHGGDVWAAALIELAWAVQHDVYARSCRVPDCGTWFFLAGRQGARKQFCTYHRQHGGAQRLWRERLRRQYPEAWKVREALRNLRARMKRKRKTISPEAYEHMAQEYLTRLEWYRTVGLAPERKSR
ncbi:MAG: hypothetical protein QN144_14885 [Armatimonadota bacterium]|nr:hypothetical protein [Armatimonadota bacterium]